MFARVAIYRVIGRLRSRLVAEALEMGFRNLGIGYTTILDTDYTGPCADFAVFYGYEGNTPRIMKEYMDAGRTVVFIDLGYFERRKGGRYRGYHKVAINARHPTAYIKKMMRMGLPKRSYQGPSIQPWKTNGQNILVAGMSARAAESIGYDPGEWERGIIRRIKMQYPHLSIIYRSKPTWLEAKPLTFAEFELGASCSIGKSLENTKVLVTRHSNTAIDALVYGVPVYCEDGVAYPLSMHTIDKLEDPDYPENREEWLNALAWCQFEIPEIESGFMWDFLTKHRFFK
jgi:hypothetical protein